MRKFSEIESPSSCFSKAGPNELIFVLLSRDPAAPVAIRAWIAERIRLGKNNPGDHQVHEAALCAGAMECERDEYRPGKQLTEQPVPSSGSTAPGSASR